MRKLALLIAAPLFLAACSGQAGSAPGGTTAQGKGSEVGMPVPAPAVDAAAGYGGAASAPNAGIPTVVVSGDRNLILTAKIDMRSKDPWATSDRAQAIATGLGGDVLNLSQTGTADTRSATLTIRVPSSRFGDALQQLKSLEGEVQTSGVSAQDVTDQFIDLQARLTAKQAEEQRYIAILNRANTIDEILKVDASLGNVRTQIEQLTAQINSIKQRTDFSTISMSISTLSALPGDTTTKVWDPAKTVGRALAALGAMMQVFADALIWLIVFGVEGALVYAVWRYRASRHVAGEAATFENNRRLEIAWTAAPALILAVVFVLTLGAMAEINGAGVAPAMRITAIGHQWWWEFSYGGIRTANELHIPVDTPVDLEVTSVDVIHSFWVPELGPKMDMLPGKTNRLRLFTRRAGSYDGQCAEFCGVEHAWMRIRVIAETQTGFDQWLSGQTLPAPTQGGAGERVFLSNICVSCHTIRGTAAAGTAGADPTPLRGRATIGAGVIPSDVARMRAWLTDPQRYQPGSLMPRVPLAEADLDALAAYLVSLK